MLLYARLAAALVGALVLSADYANACGCRSAQLAPAGAAAAPAAAAPAPVAVDNKEGTKAADEKEEADIQKNLGKLSPEDRKLAEAQKYCAVEDDNRLGAMGVPVKITLQDSAGKDQTVFLCCKSCKKDAEKDPAATLAKVEKLKAKAKEEDKKK
jgi:hypothetical protein